MRSSGYVLLSLAFALVDSSVLFGQSDTAALSGEVCDPSGAVISGALVSVTNTATGVTKITTTTGAGLYVVEDLLNPLTGHDATQAFHGNCGWAPHFRSWGSMEAISHSGHEAAVGNNSCAGRV